jgi:hypothetical protein
MPKSKIPPSLLPHSPDYRAGSWRSYSICELGWFVHLLAKRAQHRENPEKKRKDLYDAQNYLNIIQAKLDALKE